MHAPHPPHPEPAPTDALTLWRALQSRKALVLLCSASAALAAVGLSLLIPQQYESRVVFMVNEAGELPASGAAARALLGGDAALATHVVTLQSMAIRREVAAQVKNRSPHALEGAVDVSVHRKAALQVRVLDSDPVVAARLANAYPPALELFLQNLRNARRDASMDALGAQHATALQRLDTARLDLGQFLEERRTPSLQREQDLLLARLQQVQAELSAAELRQAAVDQRLVTTTQQLRSELMQTASGLQSPVPAVQRLAQELATLEVDLAAARAEYDGDLGAQHPKVKSLMARVQARRLQLDKETAASGRGADPGSTAVSPDQLREQMRRDLLELQRQRISGAVELARRRADVDQLRTQLGRGQGHRLREMKLQQELESALRDADALGQRVAELKTQALRRERLLTVLTEAEPAASARFPSAIWNGLLASLLGAVVGLYLALYSRLSGLARAADGVGADVVEVAPGSAAPSKGAGTP